MVSLFTLFTDLDNTLIYSKNREVLVPKTCVEVYKGEQFSFMTDTSVVKLKRIQESGVGAIPVTTRTLEQYNRIELTNIRYALVDNGGILLEDGRINEDWRKESLFYADACRKELDKACCILEQDENRNFEVRSVDDLFVFTKGTDSVIMVQNLKDKMNTDKLLVFNQGKKIYVLPKELSKGNAIKRFRGIHDCGYTVSAGDAPLDFSMAQESDVFITSDKTCNESNAVISENKVFSDEVLEYVLGLM